MDMLKGKVGLVAGGTLGIGRAAVLAFAREGASVVFAGRRIEPGEELAHQIIQAGGQALFVQADVTKADEVERLVKVTVEKFGRLDCALNNAATLPKYVLTADITEEAFDHELAYDLKSVWLGMKYEIRQMLAQTEPGGAIVNTSSINGVTGVPGAAVYSLAKSAILSLTKTAALEYASKNIRINSLIAGAFDTPMMQEMIETVTKENNLAPDAIEKDYNTRIPLGRKGRPEEAAEAIVWLCSDAASYVTAHSMAVDGGWSSQI